jgi:hypothetical protein
METVKEQVMNLISRLPAHVTWQEILYRIHVRWKIERGTKAAEESRMLAHDEVRRLFARPE